MMDLEPQLASERSAQMTRGYDHDTGPERVMRHLLHGLGYRKRFDARPTPDVPLRVPETAEGGVPSNAKQNGY